MCLPRDTEPGHPDHPAADDSSVHDCVQRVLPALQWQAEELFQRYLYGTGEVQVNVSWWTLNSSWAAMLALVTGSGSQSTAPCWVRFSIRLFWFLRRFWQKSFCITWIHYLGNWSNKYQFVYLLAELIFNTQNKNECSFFVCRHCDRQIYRDVTTLRRI